VIILGVDIGGSGIKGALVNTETGELVSERIRIETPQPATPEAVANTLKELVSKFEFEGPIGCGFPATVHHGMAFTAANIDKTWINTQIEKLFTATINKPCYVLNDADAAGIAEIKFGAGASKTGVVMMITIGTGLGSAIFVNGNLLPNTELGHIILNDDIAEHYCSDAARQLNELSWGKWGKRFNKYLERLQFLFNPDLFILGGGASKSFDKFAEKITIRTPVVTATKLNAAGIIGAAIYAAELYSHGQLPNTNEQQIANCEKIDPKLAENITSVE
jgi:polyphosphate glucokinase